jgi:hypothetical protein
MEILGIAQQGLDRAQGQFEKAASRIAQTPDPGGVDDVVDLLQGKNGVEANLRVARIADEMTKHTLDLLA